MSVLDKIEGCLGKYNYKAHEWWSFVFSMFRVQWVVPERVVDVIKQSWHIIEQFALMPDRTVKIIGMKFPADGIVHF